MTASVLASIGREVADCRACPRLVEWRERTAREKVARFAEQTYWGRPVPGFGDPDAGVLVLGLAPAAHGGNRTGRIFTGDRSGDFLFASMFRVGLANQSTSVSLDDGLRLHGAYVTAVNRCAPPANKPTPEERDRCLPFLVREMEALEWLRVVVALGSYGWEGALRAFAALGHASRPKPRFGHGSESSVGPYTLLGCFHPSQQNTFTGKLTTRMMDTVMARAVSLAEAAS
ncbi:MAG: uracil-DNA glycosylase [Actinomycetota bacterium]